MSKTQVEMENGEEEEDEEDEVVQTVSRLES